MRAPIRIRLVPALLALALAAPAPAQDRPGAPVLPEAERRAIAAGIDGNAASSRREMAERAARPRVRPVAPVVAAAPADSVPADVPEDVLDARTAGTVELRAHVAATGAVDSVVVVSGDRGLRDAAAAAVRWWIYPRGTPHWTLARVRIDGDVDVNPLRPDVLAMARDAERDGRPREALDAWLGALARVGDHPALANAWAIREHIVRLVARMRPQPPLPKSAERDATVARVAQQHAVASGEHADLVVRFDGALAAAPWWAEAYQWRAASLLACGRTPDALRSLRLFRLGATDAASRAIADRALELIAHGDTLVASQWLKHQGRRFESQGPPSETGD